MAGITQSTRRGSKAHFPAREQGAVVLAMSIVLLFILTFITFFAARVGVVEQRVSANEQRAEESFTSAENAIEQGMALLYGSRGKINSTKAAGGWLNAASDLAWQDCASTAAAMPCGDGTSNLYGSEWRYIANAHQPNATPYTAQPDKGSYALHFLTRDDSEGHLIRIIAQGASDDATGVTIAQQDVFFLPTFATPPPAPLIASGNVAVTGNFSVVPNPDTDVNDSPLSVWSGSDVDLSGGTGQTCHWSEYLATGSPSGLEDDAFRTCDDCDCPSNGDLADTGVLSNSSPSSYVEGIDILDIDNGAGENPDTTDFPTDLFAYLFNEEPAVVKQDAYQPANGCDDLGPNSAAQGGVIWIAGPCPDFPSNTEIGSAEEPVIIVLEDASTEAHIKSNTVFYGILFSYGSVKLNGGAIFYGAILAENTVSLANGNNKVVYSREILERVVNSPGNRRLGKLAGTWFDYL